MNQSVVKMQKVFFKIKAKFLSWRDWFINTRFGNFVLFVAAFLGKFFNTKKGKAALIVASFISYLVFFKWQLSALVIVMLFAHEYGHIWAMRHYKMKVGGMYFIPFVGAAVSVDSKFLSRKADVVVAIAGPIGGCIPAVVLTGIYFATHNTIYAVLAGFVVVFNLFNLLPFYPLDGGRIVSAIAYSIHPKMEKLFLLFSIICLVVFSMIFANWDFFFFSVFLIVLSIVVLIVYITHKAEEVKRLNFAGILISSIFYLMVAIGMFAFSVWAFGLPDVQVAMHKLGV